MGFGATILCVSSRYLCCDSSAAASMAWLIRGRQRWVGRLARGLARLVDMA